MNKENLLADLSLQVKLAIPTESEQEEIEAYRIPNKHWLKKNKVKFYEIEEWSNETYEVFHDLDDNVYYQLDKTKETQTIAFSLADVQEFLNLQKKECALMAQAILSNNGIDDTLLLDQIDKEVTNNSKNVLCA